jgi:cytoskeletal protein CcmA (bactofilin family)
LRVRSKEFFLDSRVPGDLFCTTLLRMTNIGKGISITGTVESAEPLAIAGNIKGDVHAGDHEVTLEEAAHVEGAVLARSITVSGRSKGRLVAKDVVRLRAGARVQAEVSSPRFALEDGAVFNGRVDPSRTEAAFRVAEHRKAESA